MDVRTSGRQPRSLDGVMIPIARHSEFGNRAAEMIWKECEAKLGEDWWR